MMMRGSESEIHQAELKTEFEGPSIEERKEIIERFRSYLMLLKRWSTRTELEEASFPSPGED